MTPPMRPKGMGLGAAGDENEKDEDEEEKEDAERDLAAAKPALEVTVVPDGAKRARVRVANTGSGVAGAVRLQMSDVATGNRVLPAYFSDGWFNLLPGE